DHYQEFVIIVALDLKIEEKKLLVNQWCNYLYNINTLACLEINDRKTKRASGFSRCSLLIKLSWHNVT
ncbi:hypothetical protein, partial [Lacticaseibacillus paracasei]|uniref:hypothetical protein n=1 Tax=Lacticaseibacillus paracasei TaxID=1597 RepID=UPI002B2283B9